MVLCQKRVPPLAIYQQCIRSSSFWLEHLSPHSLDYLCILETNFVYLDKIHSEQMNQTCKVLSKLFDKSVLSIIVGSMVLFGSFPWQYLFSARYRFGKNSCHRKQGRDT